MKLLPNTVINLHEIQDPKWLDTIIESLKKHYHIIRIEELEDYYYNNGDLQNTCHITFDDGDISFYNNALPVIKKHKIPVSIYVSPLMATEQKNFWFQEIKDYNEEKLIEITKKVTNNYIGNIKPISIKPHLKKLQLEVIWEIIEHYQKATNTPSKPSMNMTKEQLLEVRSSGLVTIGAHTLNHPVLINEEDVVVLNEIERSIDLLSEILKCKTKYFAYPNGDFGEREINILRNMDIKLAFSTKRDKISCKDNSLCIPRSGSPIISKFQNNQAYTYSKYFLQLVGGEKRYYRYARIWNRAAQLIYAYYSWIDNIQ